MIKINFLQRYHNRVYVLIIFLCDFTIMAVSFQIFRHYDIISGKV
jgi:hypothetical protein